MPDATCPLCGEQADQSLYFQDTLRRYYQCTVCRLVYIPPEQFVTAGDEKKRYDLHQNFADDSGYQAYLSRLLHPMLQRLRPASRGLDFGCGPEPVLAELFRRAGHAMTAYDVFYQPEKQALEDRYDFITATEVAEHLRDPRQELERLWACLKPGGILGIMTQWVVPADQFPRWHYKNDRTHICFYSEKTFEWLARKWGARIEFPVRDVVLIKK